jgi:hypothetical protein
MYLVTVRVIQTVENTLQLILHERDIRAILLRGISFCDVHVLNLLIGEFVQVHRDFISGAHIVDKQT